MPLRSKSRLSADTLRIPTTDLCWTLGYGAGVVSQERDPTSELRELLSVTSRHLQVHSVLFTSWMSQGNIPVIQLLPSLSHDSGFRLGCIHLQRQFGVPSRAVL